MEQDGVSPMRELILPALAGLLFTTPAMAETTQRDLEVIGHALSFVEGASGSDRTVALVYDAGSEVETQALASAMAGGLAAGRVTLNARLVPMADTGSLGGADAAVLLGSAAGDGDYSLDIAALERSDELGAVVESLRRFREKGRQAEELEKEQRAQAQANERRAAKLHNLAQTFDAEVMSVLGEFNEACSSMSAIAEQLSQAATEGSEQSGQMASSAAQASANVESVAAASEELTASIAEVTQQIQGSSDMARQANERAKSVRALSERAEKLNSTVETFLTEVRETG